MQFDNNVNEEANFITFDFELEFRVQVQFSNYVWRISSWADRFMTEPEGNS